MALCGASMKVSPSARALRFVSPGTTGLRPRLLIYRPLRGLSSICATRTGFCRFVLRMCFVSPGTTGLRPRLLIYRPLRGLSSICAAKTGFCRFVQRRRVFVLCRLLERSAADGHGRSEIEFHVLTDLEVSPPMRLPKEDDRHEEAYSHRGQHQARHPCA